LHLHEPLSVSSTLGWPALIEETLLNFPRFAELAARDSEAKALSERGGKWFSGPPQVYAGYLSDQALSDTDMAEYELGVELPLWRWNQRSAAQVLGTTASSESIAAASALRHQVIGLLRTALWDIERANIAVTLAEDGIVLATELLRVVTRRHEAGDLPLTDALLAQSALLEREAALIESNATLLDAERAYRSLTGLDRRPANFKEVPILREELNASHPWLVMADAAVARSEAELELVEGGAKGPPVLTLGSRRERGAYTDFYVDSIGLQVKVPFGGEAHRSTKTANSLRSVSVARADRAQLARRLELELHEAHHSLVVVDASLALAQKRSDLADRRLQMGEQAFAQGEMTLFELLLQQELALTTQMEAARLEAERQRAIAAINQALGEWP
jgi:outer membrane protein TolC